MGKDLDCVTCGGTVEMFDNVLKFFKEVNIVLKTNGRFIVSMTNPYSLPRILQNILFSKSMFSESKGTSEYHRLFFLSSRDLIYLLNHAGFNRVKIYKGAGMNIPKTDIYITCPKGSLCNLDLCS